jgi:hypothetical protein
MRNFQAMSKTTEIQMARISGAVSLLFGVLCVLWGSLCPPRIPRSNTTTRATAFHLDRRLDEASREYAKALQP